MSSDDRAAMQIPEEVWRAVEALHGRTWPPRSEADADRFIAAANGESLLPLLYEQESLPETVAAALPRHRALLRFYEQRSATLEAGTRLVAEVLAGVSFIVYKGAHYARRLYPRPALRPMRDLDFLVPRERMDDALSVLQERGFELVPEVHAGTSVASHHERSLVGHGFSVDLHHSFVQRVRHRIDYDDVWLRRQPLSIEGVEASCLVPAHALAVHALSMAIDEFTVPLIRYVDMRRFLDVHPGLLAETIDVSRRWRTTRALYGALRLMSQLYRDVDLEVPLARLLPRSTRRFLDRYVLPDLGSPAPKATRSRQLWAKFHLIDSYSRRLLFAGYHAWTLVAERLASRPPWVRIRRS